MGSKELLHQIMEKVVITKYKTYRIPEGIEGVPVEEYFKGAHLPENLKGAKVYETEAGAVIAKQGE